MSEPAKVPPPRGMWISTNAKSSLERRQEAARAFAHGRRTSRLPPVSEAEAAELVARYLAAGGTITPLPTRAVESVNNGRGW